MKFEEKKIKGVVEVIFDPKEDERGFFMRSYDADIFKEKGVKRDWVQESDSLSKNKGTVRGLHFQFEPDTEAKYMRVVSGELFIAIVDIRKNSETFGQWVSLILSAKKKNAVLVPRGCTNGICTLTDDVLLVYKMDRRYNPNTQAVINWNDPDLNIGWPIKEPAVISERDSDGMSFKEFVEKYGGLDI